MSDSDDAHNLYYYNPSKGLPIMAIVLFAVATSVIVVRTHMDRGWRYMWPWIGGCLLETAGYGVRRASIEHPTTDDGIGLYATSQTFIIVAPALFAATLYMTFGRMVVQADGGERSPIRPSIVTKVFVSFDVLSFLIQCSGGGMFATKDEDTMKAAKSVLLVGLIMQIVAFGVFLAFSVVYKMRIDRYSGGLRRHHKWLLWLLWTQGTLILIRSIYRTVEFGESKQSGNDEKGYLLTHEVFFYVLETVPMILCVALMAIVPLSMFLKRDEEERTVSDEKPV